VSSVSKKILIVDDDALIRKIIRFHLKDIFHVHEAENGERAISKSREHKFDAILMDISMKGIDGLQATRIIRKDPAYSEVPIVALTGHTLVSDRENFFSAGCSHYLPKPFDKADLINLLNEVLA
jgi:CheY-like chemotaxis protein